jgi:hypothetical protein
VAVPATGVAARRAFAWAAGITGLIAYDWWVLVPLRPGLMKSPNELFSNLEVTGQPFAAAMQRADIVSGVLLLVAFAVAGSRSIAGGRREWRALLVFAAAGSAGGIFPETCADEISASCRRMEWAFQLPLQDYLHSVSGIVEFAALTLALVFAYRRTRGSGTGSARVYRALVRAMLVAYPLLGLAYLTSRLGGVMEAIFYTGFTAAVIAQLTERARGLADRERAELAGPVLAGLELAGPGEAGGAATADAGVSGP